MSGLDHIFLYCLMFALAIIYDKQYRLSLYNSSTSIRPNILPLISASLAIVFIITEGLRYGRGVDQIGNYGPFYLHCMRPDLWQQKMEWLFVLLNQAVFTIDFTTDFFPFGLIFVIYAAIFWYCLWKLYKDYRGNSKYFLVFAIMATNFITEWTIRQGVSYGFILLGIHYLLNQRLKQLTLCVIIAFGIHNGNIVAILLLGLCYTFLNKKPLPWKITVPLFIFLEFTMLSTAFWGISRYIFNSLNQFPFMEKFQGYAEQDVFEMESNLANEWQRGIFTQLITVAFYSSLLIIGNLVYRRIKNKDGMRNVFIYNSFVIGIMLFEPFRLSGSLIRGFIGPSTLWFIPISLAFYYIPTLSAQFKVCRYAIFIIILYCVMFLSRYIFLNSEANYIWNL